MQINQLPDQDCAVEEMAMMQPFRLTKMAIAINP
jgi:hypothetical protein